MFRNAFCAAPSCSGISRRAADRRVLPHERDDGPRAPRVLAQRLRPSARARADGARLPLRADRRAAHLGRPARAGLRRRPRDPRHPVHSVGPAAIEALHGGIPEPFFMSVGFFETHRSFFAPSSVRDRVYSLPPPFLPDTPEIREDIAAYKASARSLDHGVGAVLERVARDRPRRAHAGDLHDGPRARVPDRQGEPAGPWHRGRADHPRARGSPAGGARRTRLPRRHLPDGLRYGRDRASAVGASAARSSRWSPARRTPDVRSEIFSELTYHAAYEPQRAIRTERYKYIRRFDEYPYPVLPNCDDSPSKNAYLERGWATAPVARESLHDLFFNPGEGRNLHRDPRLRAGARRPA